MTTSDCDVLVIGAGISGLVTAKVLKECGLKVTVLERTGEVGGLWTYRPNDYGVMSFTHINVSKYNYCFSDFPFKDEVPDYPHNTHMAQYIGDYVKHNKLNECIHFFMKVMSMERTDGGWKVKVVRVKDDGKTETDEEEVINTKRVAIASGHHAKPIWPKFRGEETFTGKISHGVEYKDAVTNGIMGKKVLVVGIGNSAVDVAANIASSGSSLYISTRSGTWVIPNYIFGHAIDLYACRAYLSLPWRVGTWIFELIIRLVSGNPKRWKLNPKMHALQAQPTVSPTLIHHIQRGNVKVVPDILRIAGSTVHFIDGQSADFDHIFCCTGYSIHLPFLPDDICNKVLDKDTNTIKLYKNVFSPDFGSSLAFIGFIQPASGGILTMSEMQAMWFAGICKNRVQLPTQGEMIDDMRKQQEVSDDRYYRSYRHTMEKDPILYNDDIASLIGAKPEIWKHPTLAWRLLFGSCGAAQWRLQGPFQWEGAEESVLKVPFPELLKYGGMMMFILLAYLIMRMLCFIYNIF